jgi:hypothetical protein
MTDSHRSSVVRKFLELPFRIQYRILGNLGVLEDGDFHSSAKDEEIFKKAFVRIAERNLFDRFEEKLSKEGETDILKLEEFDTGCPICGAQPNGILRVLVAFSQLNKNACVVAADRHFICDSAEAGIDAGDIWTPGKEKTPDHGLWVWEGRIVYTTTPDTPNGPAEFDVDYERKWREPTTEEWQEIMNQRNPWEELQDYWSSLAEERLGTKNSEDARKEGS